MEGVSIFQCYIIPYTIFLFFSFVLTEFVPWKYSRCLQTYWYLYQMRNLGLFGLIWTEFRFLIFSRCTNLKLSMNSRQLFAEGSKKCLLKIKVRDIAQRSKASKQGRPKRSEQRRSEGKWILKMRTGTNFCDVRWALIRRKTCCTHKTLFLYLIFAKIAVRGTI